MTFLNPGILLGLLAISIPILIHLLNLRKIRKVDFSTLMFLKEIQKSKMRRIKLKQLLLLLLRVMAIILLVLSFANPVYEGYAGNSDNFNKTAVIVIDDSFSMNARDDKGAYLNQAKDAVKKILESHKESDNIYFVSSSLIDIKGINGVIESKTVFDSFQELRDSLEKIRSANKPADITQIMNFSKDIFDDSKNQNKELYIISDFQKNNFDNITEQKFFNKMEDYPVNVFLVKTGDRQINNLSLDSFSIETKIIEKDKDTRVRIFLNNHSQFSVKNKTVNLYLENELKSEKSVDAGSFEKKEIEFNFKPGKSGYLSGMIELVQSEFGEDELAQDNKYYFTLFIPEKFNIGILEASQDYKYIDLAVRSASTILSDSIGNNSDLFRVNLFGNINTEIFKNDVIFISGKNNFSENDAGILKDYLSQGGGVFMFPGSEADLNNYNNILFSKINSVKFGGVNTDESTNSTLKFEKINFENPLLAEVFSNQDLSETNDRFNVESPAVKSYYELISSDRSNSIITFTNDRPFLIESKVSAGKLIVSSLPLSSNFSDLTGKSIFLPLIIRSIYYLSNNFSYQTEYILGRSNLITLSITGNVNELIMPDKTNIKLNSENDSGNETDVFKSNYYYLPYSKETVQSGIYELMDSSGSKNLFALNVDPKESNPDTYNEDEILEYFNSPGIKSVRFIEDNESISSEIKTADTGLSLWKYFLIGAVLFILGEMLLSKKIESS